MLRKAWAVLIILRADNSLSDNKATVNKIEVSVCSLRGASLKEHLGKVHFLLMPFFF